MLNVNVLDVSQEPDVFKMNIDIMLAITLPLSVSHQLTSMVPTKRATSERGNALSNVDTPPVEAPLQDIMIWPRGKGSESVRIFCP